MKKVLLIASEYAPGMLSFASSIINRLSESNEFEIYAVVEIGRASCRERV